MIKFAFSDTASADCNLEIPQQNFDYRTFAVYIDVPKQCHFGKIFTTLETVNPSFAILALDPADTARTGFRDSYHMSGREGNVPWVWTVLGKNSQNLIDWLTALYKDQTQNKN